MEMKKSVYDDLGICDLNKLNQKRQALQPLSLGCPLFDDFLK